MTTFDAIVVGAGSAGAPLAAALSADGSRRVLLLEAGPDYTSAQTPPEIRGANFGPALRLGRYHWTSLMARTTDETERKPYIQGRGVGGSSAINGQGAVRPLPDDLDRWAAAGCKGWSWGDVLSTFIAIEDDADFGDRPYHGRGGPVPVTRTGLNAGPVSRAVRDAAVAAGHPEHPDLNAPDHTGVSAATWNRRDGGRVSTNDAYLEAARHRANLEIRGDSPVGRVLFASGRVTGVETTTGMVDASEVYLCAGALHSPAILLRSGVGPAADLRALGIDVVADLAGVGRGLQEHPMMWLTFPLLPEAITNDPDALPGHAVLRWSSGAPGAAEHDLELLSLDRSTFNPAEGGLMVSLMQPRSRGRLRLATPDPSAEPVVDFRLLSHPDDPRRLIAGVRHAADLCRSPALAAVMAGPVAAAGRAVEDLDAATLEHTVRTGCMEYFHAAGTCRMGDPDDPATVVDPDCRVLGVDGLRVVDASVLPDLPRAPTHLTAVALAVHLARRLVITPAG